MWWRAHAKEFPLLSKAAKKYLCIQVTNLNFVCYNSNQEYIIVCILLFTHIMYFFQATSASSERVFSTGGAIVTYKRTKLDPENVHMLVYCKDNLPRVKISPRNYQDPEEEAEEEEVVDNDMTKVNVNSRVENYRKGTKSAPRSCPDDPDDPPIYSLSP